MPITIGQLAKRAGLTVRTLHHYDHIGLLIPTLRTENGFRLYNREDVIRLQRIKALKQFGCSLAEIRSFLDEPQASLANLINRQIAFLDRRIESAKILRSRLCHLNEQMTRGKDVDLPDWLTLLEIMAIYERRFSRQELDILHHNKITGNLDRKWQRLAQRVQQLMDKNTPVNDDKVRKCARIWIRLVGLTTGNDPILAEKLKTTYSEEPAISYLTGITQEMGEYMKKAIKTARVSTRDAARQLTLKRHIALPPKPTALGVARLRAVHQIVDKPLIFEDPFAERIICDSIQNELLHCNEPLYRGLRTSIAVRSRLAEDLWLTANQADVRQVVILGAGLDTFALRHGYPADLTIFEVDLPTTQRWKRNCLQMAGIVPPPTLKFVATDFESLSLGDVLMQAGFRQDFPAFFTWLGVTMYIDETAIYETLRFIASCAPKTSVVFDYCVIPALLSPRECQGLTLISKKVSEHGEPWKTFFDPSHLFVLLKDIGFTEIEDFGPEELTMKYLAGRTDGLKKSGTTRIICCKT